MRLVTWNVNSVSARLPRVLELLAAEAPDVVCLQETRVSSDAFPHLPLAEAGYQAVGHGLGGRNGVAVLARDDHVLEPVCTGLPGEPRPDEARWVEADVDGVRIASVYVPNGKAVDAPEFAGKLAFLEAMAERAGELVASGAPVVIAGDVNVCATDADAWDIAALHGGTHATPQERERLALTTAAGYTDAYRAIHPDEPGFTWWDYRGLAFPRGEGLRIDQVLLGGGLDVALADARVLRELRKGHKPSDHAPLLAELTG